MIVEDKEAPDPPAFMKIAFHNRLIDVSIQGFGFCGLHGYAGGLYLSTGRKENKAYQKMSINTPASEPVIL